MACHLNFYFYFFFCCSNVKKRCLIVTDLRFFFCTFTILYHHSQPSIHISISWPMFFFLGLKLILIYSVGVFIVTQTPELVPLDWLFFHFHHFFYVIFIWWQWYKLFFSQNSWPNIIKWHFFFILFHFIWFQSFVVVVVVVDCRQTKIEFYFGLRKKMAKDIRIVDYITEKRWVVYWWCMVSEGKQTHQQARVFWILLIFFLVLFCFLFWIWKKNTRILIKSLKSSSHMMMRMMLKKTNVDVFIHWL